ICPATPPTGTCCGTGSTNWKRWQAPTPGAWRARREIPKTRPRPWPARPWGPSLAPTRSAGAPPGAGWAGWTGAPPGPPTRVGPGKRTLPGALAGREGERFSREARAAARLRHPNVLPILGMGLHEGRHCFTMPLIPGGNLAERLPELVADRRAAVALVEK